MRKVTVHRQRRLVGCAVSVLVFAVENFDIAGKMCKEDFSLLGKIKNGQLLESEIVENEVAIVAAYDSLGEFMITDYITIPQGTEDVILKGEIKLAPLKGNPFLFEKYDFSSGSYLKSNRQ